MEIESFETISLHIRSLEVKNNTIRCYDTKMKYRTMFMNALKEKNIPLCRFLIGHNIHQLTLTPYSSFYLPLSIHIEEIFDSLLHECTDSAEALETFCELISKRNLPLIKKVLDKYNHYVSLDVWEDTWKTNDKVMTSCLRGNINRKITKYLINLGFATAAIGPVAEFIKKRDESKAQSLISIGLIGKFSKRNMRWIFYFLLGIGYVCTAEKVREMMIKKGYTYRINLEVEHDTHSFSGSDLMSVPLSKLYQVIDYAIKHCSTFNCIKDAYYEGDGDRKYLPETVLSYLAFVNKLDAMKLIIENPNCSFEPSHLVACSLFRGHYTSRFFKLSLPIYDEIFDYLMHDDIRPRVLGDDREWIDKCIFIAIRYGNERMVKKLVELGADLTNIFINSYHASSSTYARYSLLSYACEYQTADLVQFLIDKGVPIEGTMIDALGEPMINNYIKESEDNTNNDNDDDDDDGDDDDDDKPATTHSFFFPGAITKHIQRSLYPRYFNRTKINKNRDLESFLEFDFVTLESEDVYLLNMTPLSVAIHKQNVEIMRVLLSNGADPMGRCMTNFPALFCLSKEYFGCATEPPNMTDEDTDYEILERYPLEKNKTIDAKKRLNDQYHDIEERFASRSHFTTTLTTKIQCINIESFLAKYSHKLECQLHGSTTPVSKRQRRCKLGEMEIVDDDIQNHTNINNNAEMIKLDLGVEIATNDDENSVDTTIATLSPPPPQRSGFVYRNNIPELFQLLIDYGAPAEYDTEKSGTVIQSVDFSFYSDGRYTPETLLVGNSSYDGYASYATNIILFLAKNNIISLEKFDELIDRCFSKAKSQFNTEQIMNVCELLSAIVYPTSEASPSVDISSKSKTSPTTLDRKIALTSGVLDPEYSDKLYDLAIDKIYGSNSNIDIFMRLTKAYPKFFSLNMQHSNGQSLLDNGNIMASFQLVQLGLDINHVTSQGDSLLLDAVEQESTTTMYRLISFGADIGSIGNHDDDCEFIFQRSLKSRSIGTFIKKCGRVVELLKIMNQYQNDKCICPQDGVSGCTHTETIEAPTSTFQPFSLEDYELLASSCVPEYTFGTLSYFFSSCADSTFAVCFTCKQTLTKNDHCRPYQTTLPGRNGKSSGITYIHDSCFFKKLDVMIRDCMTKIMSNETPKYIRNPTTRYPIHDF